MTPDKRTLYTGGAIGLTLAALAGFGLARLTAPSAPAPAPAAEEADEAPATGDAITITAEGIRMSDIGVAPATSGSISGTVLGSGTVQATPDAQAVVTARAPGTVTRLFKRIGDSVRAGEAIALVESRDASTIVADRGTASARVTLAAKQLARERTLLAQGVSPRADFETAQANLAVAQAEMQQASAAARAARVAGDGRSVAVVSAISGRITAASANLGAYVQADTELFRVADPRRIQIEVSVPADAIASIRTGDPVEMTGIDGQVIAGRVRAATGVVDPQSRQATVIVTPNGDGALAPGQMIQTRIHASGASGAHDGLLVPQDAVQTLGDRTVIFVRTRNGFHAQTVQTGGRNGGLVAILSGLKHGTEIATRNAFLLKAELEKGATEE